MSIPKNKNKIELLAPAGDLEKMKYAIHYGADAVYLGLPEFSLRVKTGFFDLKSIKIGCDYAHQYGKKVYLTMNVFVHNEQLPEIVKFLKQIKKINFDGLILSDPGIIALVKKYLPKVKLILSTQANTLNYEAVLFWQKQGVKRIILGRETTLADIKKIHQMAPKMELEVFVHGAMCMSYSGRCYLSAWLNGRSANEGFCTQPCRWEYKVYPVRKNQEQIKKLEDFIRANNLQDIYQSQFSNGVFLEEGLRPGEMIPVEFDQKGMYILNSKDLCLIDYLKELQSAGITSFKIEGRTKSLYYVATVTRVYRQAMNQIQKITPIPSIRDGATGQAKTKNQENKNELLKVDNRGYTTGFLFNQDKDIQNFKTSKLKSEWEFVGQITKSKNQEIKKSREQEIVVKIHNVLKIGDEIEILTPENVIKNKVKNIYNQKGEIVSEAHGGTKEIFTLELNRKCDILEWSLIRKKLKI